MGWWKKWLGQEKYRKVTGFRSLGHLTKRSGEENETLSPIVVLNTNIPNWNAFVGADVEYEWEVIPQLSKSLTLQIVVRFSRPHATELSFDFDLTNQEHVYWLMSLSKWKTLHIVAPDNTNVLVNPVIHIESAALEKLFSKEMLDRLRGNR